MKTLEVRKWSSVLFAVLRGMDNECSIMIKEALGVVLCYMYTCLSVHVCNVICICVVLCFLIKSSKEML